MNPPDYGTFQAALRERSYLDSLYQQKMSDLQSAFESAIIAGYRSLYPKRKAKDWRAALHTLDPEGQVFRKPWDDAAESLSRERRKALDGAEEALWVAAAGLPLPASEALRPPLYAEFPAHHYWTMGYSACTYAKAAANRLADKARAHGRPAEVHEIERHRVHGRGWSQEHATYGVFIDTDRLGWEILQRKPVASMRELVRMAWKQGVNPRVMWPFLPHGFEEENGLDFFGNETWKTA